jgi:hypothetical protein
VNDSARNMMAALAEYRNDQAGSVVSTGSLGVYAATIAQSLTAYNNGIAFSFRANHTNTIAAPTMNANSLGALPIVRPDGSAIGIGNIVSGRVYSVYCTTTQWIMTGCGLLPSDALFGSMTVSGAATFNGTTLLNGFTSRDGAAATLRTINYRTGTTGRWYHGMNSDAESGSNAGSSYILAALSDAGSFLGFAYQINRATQVVDFSQIPTVAGNRLAQINNNTSATATVYPVGSSLLTLFNTFIPNRNQATSMHYTSADSTTFTTNPTGNVALSGTWRSQGGNAASPTFGIMQRVA